MTRWSGFWSLAIIFLALFLLAPGMSAEEHAFLGAKSCKKCHLKEYKSWEETAMAKTFDVLKPGVRAEEKKAAGLDPAKDYTLDASCVKCHVTGYGKKGGFVSFEKTPELAGVGCESCHGAGGTYVQDQYMSLKNKEYKKADIVAVGLVDTVSKAQCTSCHNSESPFVAKDFVFDFKANKDKGTHEHFELKYPH
jgi:hypothetical protein